MPNLPNPLCAHQRKSFRHLKGRFARLERYRKTDRKIRWETEFAATLKMIRRIWPNDAETRIAFRKLAEIERMERDTANGIALKVVRAKNRGYAYAAA